MALIGQKGGEARSRHFKQQQIDKKKAQNAQPVAGSEIKKEEQTASAFSKPAGSEQEKAG